MKHLIATLFVCLPLYVAAQTDITSQYLQNPSFETDDISSLQYDAVRGAYQATSIVGWTLSGNYGVSDIMTSSATATDDNFGSPGNPSDGSQMYYIRWSWNAGTATLLQSVHLPAGKYVLSLDNKCITQSSHSAWLVAGNENLSLSFHSSMPSAWTTSNLQFELTDETTLNIGLKVNFGSGSGASVLIDNFRLYSLPDDYIEPEEPTEEDVTSYTEGVITSDFVTEVEMKRDLLQMLANFSTYMVNDWQEAQYPNSVGEACGCFKGENTMGNDERGVRPNADLSMICAFLIKYAKPARVSLPTGITWTRIEELALKSLVFAYSTHKANKLKTCSNGQYWGSTSTSDAVWESSLWAMSVAYSAFFQWNRLSDTQHTYIYNLLKAECNYELQRSIPTGYSGDTKAEENGWEADVLAVTLGLFPNDDLAPQWFARLREFAINSYSQRDDASDLSVIDPDYDNKTVKNLYRGQNLYDDYTLQNHSYFHTSYQNVVIQELGEAALAMKLFQQQLYGEEIWHTNALMHNNDNVMKEVLYWLALADGELAMPNGNDWSLFLYDQITSYSTNACFLRDPHSLMLENLAYKYIKARQKTTSDGSWLLRPDVGARRMGVEAHRVMMTWLMHEALSTADMTATRWDDFNTEYSAAKVFNSQNIVRAATDSRFTTFSWSNGLKSYTGYIAANSTDKNKIIVPFRANNTGNFLGWYEVQGKGTNATPVVSGIYDLQGNSYVMNGELNTNDAALNNRFAIFSTPGNAVIYLDYVRANTDATITAEKGGLMAISVDELTKTKRTLYTSAGYKQLDGSTFTKFSGNWINIDNALGIVSSKSQMAFGERANNNSIMTARLYTAYSDQSRMVKANDLVDSRYITYYSNTDAESTEKLSSFVTPLQTTAGWGGVIVFDPDSTAYMLLTNFCSDQPCQLYDVMTPLGFPVFNAVNGINHDYSGGNAKFICEENHSIVNTIRFFTQDIGLFAIQDPDDPNTAYFQSTAECDCEFFIKAVTPTGIVERSITTTGSFTAKIVGGDLQLEEGATFPDDKDKDPTKGYINITDETLVNPSFEADLTYGNPNGNLTIDAGTFNPCYINEVSAKNSKWQNILPVEGWTAGNSLSGGSHFCRMYSMPYSTTLYCVSPKSVGNYADRCARPVFDSQCGTRTLTVLNSWDSGSNAITQAVTLPAGTYRLLLDARYICPNETSNNGKVITTSGNNTNTSLTGIKIGSKTDYRYPSEPSTWQQLCYDFELTAETKVTISLGYRTSTGAGAANNTLLYVDNLQLLRKDETPTNVIEVRSQNEDGRDSFQSSMIFDLQGRRITEFPTRKGIYIQNRKKIVINK